MQQSAPGLRREDLRHMLQYDPRVPLQDELDIPADSELGRQIRALAHSISRAHPNRDAWLPVPDYRVLPALAPVPA